VALVQGWEDSPHGSRSQARLPIRDLGPLLYSAGDLCPTSASIAKIDLEHITFPDAMFDTVICNHILEHVSSPIAALREVHRVLKVGGRFICQTPFASRLQTTFEERRLQTESDRLFFYGQEDHVRLFGSDIEQLFVQQGFVGRLVPHEDILPEIDPELFGINDREPFFDFVRA
jgi:SAM-dependent methyltransferase